MLVKADAAFHYALNMIKWLPELVGNIKKVAKSRKQWGLRATDRTTYLETQRRHVNLSFSIVKEMRSNVQSHLLLNFANLFISNELLLDFLEVMKYSEEFIIQNDIFKEKSQHLIQVAKGKLQNYHLPENQFITKIFFFKLTDHITFGKFCISEKIVWQHSTIINMVIEKNEPALLEKSSKESGEFFERKISYLIRACDLLGHIEQSSGPSIIIHYVLEMASVTRTLCQAQSHLNFVDCLVWVLVKSKTKHLLCLCYYLSRFVMETGLIDSLFNIDEITSFNDFTTGVKRLLNFCSEFDRRISLGWADF